MKDLSAAIDVIGEKNISRKFNERENALRFFLMNFIIDHKRAFDLSQDAPRAMDACHMSQEEYRDAISVLRERDGIVSDEDQKICSVYPVSALETEHQVLLGDGRSCFAMCAIDALGTAFSFQQDVEIRSRCAVSGREIRISVRDASIASASPENFYALTFKLEELTNWSGFC